MAEEYVDVIKDGEIQRVTEREAKEEGLFILRRPTLVPGAPIVNKKFTPSTPRSERNKPTYSLDYVRNNVKSELVDHFNWEISKYRRLKNLTRKQLGNLAGTSEENIKMLENGELPADNFSLISKIEHYLGVVLRKTSSTGSVGMAKPAVSIGQETKPVSQIPTLVELQKRREATRASRSSGNFGKSSMNSKLGKTGSSISGGDIEIID